MNKEKLDNLRIGIIYLALCLIVLILLFIVVSNALEKSGNQTISQEYADAHPELSSFASLINSDLTIIKAVAPVIAEEHEYILHKYDCTEFSERLVEVLSGFDINASCTAGRIDNSINNYPDHAWVTAYVDGKKVEIEATTGEIIPEDYFKEHYKVWKRGYCW